MNQPTPQKNKDIQAFSKLQVQNEFLAHAQTFDRGGDRDKRWFGREALVANRSCAM